MDGWVTIGAKLDTKQLEKDIKSSEKELENYKKESEKLTDSKVKLEADIEIKGKEFDRKIKEIQDKAKIDIQSITGGSLSRATKEQKIQETAQLKINSLQQKYSEYLDRANLKIDDIEKSISENANQQQILNTQIDEMNQKLKQSKGLDNIKESINQASNSMSGILKKVAKWSLAIFSIRSAYNFLRSSISTISQYNEQVATDIEYIKYALANTLQPIIIGIINLAKTLLSYINYIAKAWFGVDLWAKSSSESFKNAKDNVSGISKEAKKLNKQLAGFDEMNILQEDGSTSIGGGGGGTSLPSFDLATPEDVPIPSWIKWIADNKDLLIGALAGITAGLIALNAFGLKPIQSLGIGAILTGIIWLVQDITEFISDPSWENFASILGDIAVIIGGIMLVMGNWWGLLIVIIGAIVKLVAENWDKISKILGEICGWIYKNVISPVWTSIKSLLLDNIISAVTTTISIIQGIFTTVFGIITTPFTVAYETIVGVFNNIRLAISNIVSGIKKLFSGDLKGALNDFKSAFGNVFNALWTIAKAPLNLIIGGINSLIRGANKISFNVPSWVPGFGGKKFGFNIPTIPKLAKGAILSQPGRGVPVGGAIAGEAGREGYLPLDDSRVMAQLGAEIGRNVVIQLTNVTKLDSRQIAKEQKRINAQNDFAFNR